MGQRLRHFRARRGLTQEELARAAKLTPKFVSQIENDRVNPSIGVLSRIVHDGLHLTFCSFFSWDPETGEANVAMIIDLVEEQPPSVRRRLLRALEALCEVDSVSDAERRSRAKRG